MAKEAGGGAGRRRWPRGRPGAWRSSRRRRDHGPAGKYGPYINWGKVNATLPKDMTQDSVTLEQALVLYRGEAGGRRRRTRQGTRAQGCRSEGRDIEAGGHEKPPRKSRSGREEGDMTAPRSMP